MECAPKTIGVLIDDLSAIREKRRVLAIQNKVLEDQYKALEATIKEQLTENGMSLASGTRASASLSYPVVDEVTDWEAVYAFIKKTGYWHLLGRSVSAPAFRELYELEVAKLSKKRGFKPEALDPATVLPGMKPFTKVNLNLTALKVPRKVA